MISGPVFDSNKCTLCGKCIEICPRGILLLEDKKITLKGDCLLCAHCYAVCKFEAILIPGLIDKDFHLSHDGEPVSSRVSVHKGQSLSEMDPFALVQLVRSRRSVRRYTDGIPSREIIDELINFAVCAPSGSNYQSWQFTVLTSKKDISKLRTVVINFYQRLNSLVRNPLLRLLSRLFMGRTLVDYYVNKFPRTMIMLQRAARGLDPLFYSAPVVIIIHSSMEGSTPVEDAQYAGYNISLLAHALHMGTCYIGYAAEAINRVRAIKEGLGIKPENRVHLVITLGFPAVKFLRPSLRKPFSVDYRQHE